MKIPSTLALPLAILVSVAAWFRPQPPQINRADVLEFLSHVEMVDLLDGYGGTTRAVRISGINVQVVNGLGATESLNGLGNLIVGYNEPSLYSDPRTGSHNIVGGRGCGYSSCGGLVVGEDNNIYGPWCSVTGGRQNGAGGHWCSVSGGTENSAGGGASSVTGGYRCGAGGSESWVGGGYGNTATGSEASVSGGITNYAGSYASVSGGTGNRAEGPGASVSGGRNRSAPGSDDWAAGSLWEDQ